MSPVMGDTWNGGRPRCPALTLHGFVSTMSLVNAVPVSAACCGAGEVECDVDEHVFLAADHATSARFL